MNYFETQCLMDENLFKDYSRHAWPIWVKIALIFAIVMAAILLVLELTIWGRDFSTIVLLGVFVYLYTFIYIRGQRNIVRVNIRRLRESTHTNEHFVTTVFNDAGVLVHNHTTGAVITIFYDDLKRFIEGDNYYFIITKARQLVMVNKAVIDGAGHREALIEYLRYNCRNIKFRIKR